ncbi:MAG: nitrite reductase small subunit NirD [Acidobacteriota bacterium]|nr:nitrite reductase small subunit NirD [Acidobacteriota bacterium]MDH3785402.1 nitrite reductase small subunit NirD [Acidobacteriota bacterium]
MSRWVAVTEASSITEGCARTIQVEHHALAVFNEAGTFYATDDACPHQGASLAEGVVMDGRVICPLHSWVFDLKTGACPRESHEPVGCYPTRQTDDSVEVLLPTGEQS